MAKRVTESLVDDIDGSEAHGTLHFAVEGTQYEIDLSEKNTEEFHEALLPLHLRRPSFWWPPEQGEHP